MKLVYYGHFVKSLEAEGQRGRRQRGRGAEGRGDVVRGQDARTTYCTND